MDLLVKKQPLWGCFFVLYEFITKLYMWIIIRIDLRHNQQFFIVA